MAKIVGEISNTGEVRVTSHFEWSIPHVRTVLQKVGDVCQSPPYAFCNAEWTVVFERCRHYVDIHINRRVKTHSHRNSAVCKYIKIASDGSQHLFGKSQCRFHEGEMNLQASTEHEFLFKDQADFGVKIICLLECYDCKSVTPIAPSRRSGSLARDLMDLFSTGEDSDLTINVKDRLFRVHRSILRVRSPVFFSMLKHDMVEKRSGCVVIPDCEPEAFQQFLEYVYSGELKSISIDVVCNVYYIADKYQVLELKEDCVNFMLQNLSLENFCDIAALSFLHNELELLESVSKFFVENLNAIVDTDRWVKYRKENPVAANYFIKNVLAPDDHHKKKRKLGSTSGKGGIVKKRRENY